MPAHNPLAEKDPRSQAPSTPPQDRPMFVVEPSKPWFVTLISNLKEILNPPKQAPLQVSFRPMSEAELRSLNDPAFQQIAAFVREEKGFFARLSENLKALLSPPRYEELQVSSRPLTKAEMAASRSILGELETAELPWYRNLLKNLKEVFVPTKLPPLQVTSRPVQVKDIFSKDEYQGRSQVMSVFIHVGVVALLFMLGTNKTVQKAVQSSVSLIAPELAAYEPKMAQKPSGGGGGGGDRSPLPANKGKLPRPSLKQFTPPMAVVNNPNPKLVMEPTIIVSPDAALPNVNMPNYGDPLARIGPPSNGPGSGGGIGSGSGGGVGPGRGGGYGPGEGGGVGGGAFRIGGGVSAPIPIYKPEPEYSEEARKAKFQGTVMLAIIVDVDGTTKNIHVLRSLGMGLDEKAIEAVSKWRFRPGYKDGHPVPVHANVEVNFRLL
jgi:protein TonB